MKLTEIAVYRAKCQEAVARKDEKVVTEHADEFGGKSTSIHLPPFELESESRWLALAAVDAFFSWSEHVFIHMAILAGTVTTGDQVTELAEADWPEKFKAVLEINDSPTKKWFDHLVEIRRELRNSMAHGAFGKHGQAFHFHSHAGAVLVLLPHRAGSRKFMVSAAQYFDDGAHSRSSRSSLSSCGRGGRAPARLYIQESGMDLILPMASNGRDASALGSDEDMQALIDELHSRADQPANMDW